MKIYHREHGGPSGFSSVSPVTSVVKKIHKAIFILSPYYSESCIFCTFVI